MWILDVDGTRLVVSATHHPDTVEQDREELADMVAELRIGSGAAARTISAPASPPA